MKSLLIALALIGMTGTAALAQDCHCNAKHDKRHKEALLKPYKYTRQAGYVSKADCMAFQQAGENWKENSNDAYVGRNDVNGYTGYSYLPQTYKTAPESPNNDVIKGQAPQTPNSDNHYR